MHCNKRGEIQRAIFPSGDDTTQAVSGWHVLLTS